MKDPTWDKNWHQPNPGWRHEHQRIHGGLWKCRKGPNAPEMEKRCRLCSDVEIPEPTDPQKLLDDVMECIEEAMAIVAENDKKEVVERMAHKAYKPKRLPIFWHEEEEPSETWNPLEEDPDTAGPPRASFYTRRSQINYNPLRGIDDSPAATKDNALAQPMPAEDGKQKVSRDDESVREDKSAGDNRQVSKSDSTAHPTSSWEILH